MRWYTFLAGALVSLAFVACGGGSKAEETVRETAEGFVQALSDDPPKAYTYLAQDCKDSIDFLEFATGLTFIGGFVGESEIRVKNVEILERSDKEIEATYEVVLISDGEEIPLEVDLEADAPTHLVKEEGRWRFGDCAGFGAQEEFGEADVAVPAPAPPEPSALTVAQDAEADADPTLPGQYVDLPVLYGGPYPDTAQHVNGDVDFRSQGLPPTGGPHWGSSRCGWRRGVVGGALGAQHFQCFGANLLLQALRLGLLGGDQACAAQPALGVGVVTGIGQQQGDDGKAQHGQGFFRRGVRG